MEKLNYERLYKEIEKELKFSHQDDLAPPLSITEAARMTKKFIDNLPDDMVDIDLGNGL